MTLASFQVQGAIHDLNADRRWTSRELAVEVDRRAGVLAQSLTQGRNRCLIAHGDSLDFFADLLAVWRAGGVAVCLNPGLTGHEIETVAAFADPAALLVNDRNLCVANIPTMRLAEERSTAAVAEAARAPNDPALVLFTSGTTGAPKGVVHTHGSIGARLRSNVDRIGPATLARTLCVLPTHFGHGLIGNSLTPLAAGGALYLAPGNAIAVAAGLGETVDRHGVTFMSSVPAFWRLATRLSRPPAVSALARIHVGSAPLSADLWRTIIDWSGGAVVANMYGITETANWLASAGSDEFAPEDGLVGRPWDCELAVRLESGALTAEGMGEVHVRGPAVMKGYLDRPDLTAEVLEDGWYATGDIGVLDGSGALRLTGRARYVINVGGMKVYPEEIDLLLEQHPAVVEACCFAAPDATAGDAVVAAVALEPDAEIDGEGLRSWARARIRAEAVPRKIMTLPEIPKTDRGKLDRGRAAAACGLGDGA